PVKEDGAAPLLQPALRAPAGDADERHRRAKEGHQIFLAWRPELAKPGDERDRIAERGTQRMPDFARENEHEVIEQRGLARARRAEDHHPLRLGPERLAPDHLRPVFLPGGEPQGDEYLAQPRRVEIALVVDTDQPEPAVALDHRFEVPPAKTGALAAECGTETVPEFLDDMLEEIPQQCEDNDRKDSNDEAAADTDQDLGAVRSPESPEALHTRSSKRGFDNIEDSAPLSGGSLLSTSPCSWERRRSPRRLRGILEPGCHRLDPCRRTLRNRAPARIPRLSLRRVGAERARIARSRGRRVRAADPDSGGDDPASARRRGSPRPGADGDGQDGGVRSAHSLEDRPGDFEAAGSRAHPDARAGDPGGRGVPALCRAHSRLPCA